MGFEMHPILKKMAQEEFDKTSNRDRRKEMTLAREAEKERLAEACIHCGSKEHRAYDCPEAKKDPKIGEKFIKQNIAGYRIGKKKESN